MMLDTWVGFAIGFVVVLFWLLVPFSLFRWSKTQSSNSDTLAQGGSIASFVLVCVGALLCAVPLALLWWNLWMGAKVMRPPRFIPDGVFADPYNTVLAEAYLVVAVVLGLGGVAWIAARRTLKSTAVTQRVR